MTRSLQTANPLGLLTSELYEKSPAERFGMTRERFAAILASIRDKALSPSAPAAAVCELYLSLRLEELVLARACADGSDPAWQEFVARYRSRMLEISRHIAREESAARELADSLYASLYGTSLRQGERVSKLASYSGRGSLEGWLRTVLAQEFVNGYRKQKRLVRLEEETEDGKQFAAAEPVPQPASDGRLEAAVDGALAALPSEDRVILAAYYLDERTLAEIGRMLGQHESTVSRRLARIAKWLRKRVIAELVTQGLSRAAAEEALETDVRDVQMNLRQRLAQDRPTPTFLEKKS